MTVDTRTDVPDGSRIGALWAANLLGPVASLIGLELGYALNQRACDTGQMLPLHLSFVSALLLALLGTALGWREWRYREARLSGEEGGPEGRSRFLALLGVLTGAMFSLVILVMWSATLFLHPCQ